MRILNSDEAWRTVQAAIQGWGPALRLVAILLASVPVTAPTVWILVNLLS